MLKAWRANMDSQTVFDYYQTVSYISAYFSKSESETSQDLLQTCSDIRSMNLNVREVMHKLASYYLISRKVSLPAAVYNSLPEIWLRKYFSRAVFVNASKQFERIQICKSVEEIEEVWY